MAQDLQGQLHVQVPHGPPPNRGPTATLDPQTGDRERVPLRSLGILERHHHRDFHYHEWVMYKVLRDTVTTRWWVMQYSTNDNEVLQYANNLFGFLELDSKACQELMLLAISGDPGRAEFNEIVWKICTDWALEKPYRDLSNKISVEVLKAHRHFDRPPRSKKNDRHLWGWMKYLVPRKWAMSLSSTPMPWLLAGGLMQYSEQGAPLRPPENTPRVHRVLPPPWVMLGPMDLPMHLNPTMISGHAGPGIFRANARWAQASRSSASSSTQWSRPEGPLQILDRM